MHLPSLVAGLLAALAVTSCTLTRPAPFPAGPAPAPQPGTAQPAPAAPAHAAPEVPAAPEHPAAPPKQFHLSAASSALVSQAHTQASGGDYGQAAATLERALRIEPDNPLLWVELGRVRLGENNPAQADAMGHKALSLATGDGSAQASAWRLIADAARARGRTADAAEAERRAQGVAAR
ncbi:MAG TPA: tetratricopeptide repeat protein [Steroidobacteraceae bacterium]|nr:tetratricopeptide repeat protein [Steroidobacteraceae bacterium]